MTDEIRVRLPRLLKRELTGTRLKEAGRFHPISMPIDLNILPLSTATMTLAENDLDVKVHDFAELYNQHGSVGIYRVASIEKVYRGRRRVELNHALDVLNDAIYATLDNDEEEFDGTPTEYITKLLGAQTQKIGNTPFWQLGTCEDTETIQKKLRFQNVLEALCDLAKTHEGFYFTFDFTTFPWTLNFVARDNTVMSEFRLNRNIASCSVTVDDSDLCTRLYLSVDTKTVVTEGTETAGEKTEQSFHVYDDLAAQNAGWGVVEKSAGVEFASAEIRTAKLQAWVNDYFARHHAPLAQISIDGQDLKEVTGVSIDEAHMGRICRVALPEYADLFLERVVTVSYPDALRKPTSVKVSLANKRQTAEDSIAAVRKEASRAGGGAGGAAKKAENNETEIERQKIIYDLKVEQDNMHFAILASEQEWSDAAEEYLLTHQSKFYQDARKFSLLATENQYAAAETGGETIASILTGQITATANSLTTLYTKTGANSLGQNETLYSKITQNATDISAEIGRATGAENTLGSRITQTETGITTLVTKTGVNSLGANETLYSQISQNASSISTIVSKAGINSLGQNETLYSLIQQNAGAIALKVSQGNVATQLAVEVGNVSITGGNLYVDGMITASNLAAQIATLQALSIPGVLYVTGAASFSEDVTFGDAVVGPGAQFTTLYFGPGGAYDAQDAIASIGPATASGGQISIPFSTFGGTQSSVNFNIADTQFYQNGVSAAFDSVTVALIRTNRGYDSANNRYYISSRADASNGNYDAKTFYVDGPTLTSQTAGTASYNASTKVFSLPVTALLSNGFSASGNITVPGTDAFNSGYSSADAASAAVGQYSSGLNWNCTVTRGDGTTKAVLANCSIPYQNGVDSVDVSGISNWVNGQATITLTNGKTATGYLPASASWGYDWEDETTVTVYCTVGGKVYSITWTMQA